MRMTTEIDNVDMKHQGSAHQTMLEVFGNWIYLMSEIGSKIAAATAVLHSFTEQGSKLKLSPDLSARSAYGRQESPPNHDRTP